MAVTKLENLINPEVMADMISAELPNALKVSKLYKVDATLKGKAGNTVTIPQWDYIGEAQDLAEGVAGEVTNLSAKDKEYTVKKAVKNVIITDEALLSGYGDPQGEAVRQLKMAIADKVDNDGVALLKAIDKAERIVKGKLGYDTICDALDVFDDEEQGGSKVLLVDKAGLKALRKDTRFIDKYSDDGMQMMKTGIVGRIAGCDVEVSNKLKGSNKAFICKPQSLTAFIKRDVAVEKDRDVLKKQTLISADEHYTVAIEDMSRIVVIDTVTK